LEKIQNLVKRTYFFRNFVKLYVLFFTVSEVQSGRRCKEDQSFYNELGSKSNGELFVLKSDFE